MPLTGNLTPRNIDEDLFSGGTIVGNVTITGNLTINGNFNFGQASVENLFLGDDDYIGFGNVVATPDVKMGWNTTQTADALFLSTATAQNVMILAETGDWAYDFAHAAQTNPTLYIQSATQSATQWLSLAHNQTNAVYNTGIGAHTFTQAVSASGAPSTVIVTGAAHTGITAATEAIGINLNQSATKTWVAGAGPLAIQREVLIQAPTYVGNVGGALTITDAATLAVNAGPTAGANMTITRSWAAILYGNIAAGDGASTAPAYSFFNDPDSGIYSSAANTVGIIAGGGTSCSFTAGTVRPGTSGILSANSTTGMIIKSAKNDGVGVEHTIIGTTQAIADATSTLLSVQNNGTTKFSVMYNGSPKLINNTWLSAVDNAGTGTVNMFKVNTSDTIDIGAALNVGTLAVTADAGAVVLIDMPVSATPAAGTEESYAFAVDSTNILKIYAESNNAGGIQYPSAKMATRFLGLQGADVASAGTIALTNGNVFELTGTTTVTLISNLGWQDGSEVTLVANESVTIAHATATSGTNITILLAGAVDFDMTANDTLTFVLCSTTAGGQAWREKARTAI
jgi:hypothetical protein